jgi:hypothetical protein
MWKTRCQPAVLGVCANQAEDGRLSGQHVLLDNARGEPIEENHHRLHRNNGLRFVTGWQTCLSFCVELSFSLSLRVQPTIGEGKRAGGHPATRIHITKQSHVCPRHVTTPSAPRIAIQNVSNKFAINCPSQGALGPNQTPRLSTSEPGCPGGACYSAFPYYRPIPIFFRSGLRDPSRGPKQGESLLCASRRAPPPPPLNSFGRRHLRRLRRVKGGRT